MNMKAIAATAMMVAETNGPIAGFDASSGGS
jgi:hypothetical protein